MLRDVAFWRERAWRAMGTTAHVMVGGGDEPLLDWAVHEIEHLEQCWSRFRPDSALCQLSARAGAWVPVPPELADILVRARSLWHHTAGAFDPTVGASMEALGYDRTFNAVPPHDATPVTACRAPGFEAVEIDEDHARVRLAAGARLDLGGIGKGLAADLVAEGIVARGAASVLVSLGGDIRTAGRVPEGGWRVPVLDPFDNVGVWAHALLGSEGIVTSTAQLRRWQRGGRRLHHIVDPLSGLPTDTAVVAVVARGREAWWAEGLAKAVMVLGEQGAAPLLDGTGVEATVFRTDRTTVTIGTTTTEEVWCSPS